MTKRKEEKTEPRHPWADPAEHAQKEKRPKETDLPGQMSIEDWLKTEGPEDDA